jgi:DNA polymerase-1
MFASLSQDDNLVNMFRIADSTGSDPFTEIGRDVYNDPTMTKSDKRRGLIKSMVYGRLYGAGVAKQAITAGVHEAQMKQVSDAFDGRFPGMSYFQRQIEDIGMRRFKGEGQGYVYTWTGRRIPCDDNRVYTLVNYLIQGGAAEVFKSNLVKLDQADLTELLIVPVHDEIVLNAPRKDAGEIMKIVQECMTTTEGWAVPLTAGIDGPMETWGDKY